MVFLFDLDGVLVRPGGYRASVQATVNYFTNQLGLGNLAPDEATIGIFEAQGVTCEWDMVPLLLLAVLDQAQVHSPHLGPLESWEAARNGMQVARVDLPIIDFAPYLRQMGRYIRPGEAASDSILAACRLGQAGDLFLALQGQGVLAELLSSTRWLARSRVTQVFETFALGDQVFTQATGLPAQLRSESLLARYDLPLLASDSRDRLVALRAQDRLRFAAYTARPSQPDGQPDELLAMYVPEAEMALAQIGIDAFPLVGTGQMGEASRQLGEPEERLTKPAPYHAIAAAATAWTGDRCAALEWTEQLFCCFERNQNCASVKARLGAEQAALPANLQLHIFEDSPTGMRGGKLAAELLAQLGINVQLNLWGVSEHAEKAAALRLEGAQVFPDVNQALDAALSRAG